MVAHTRRASPTLPIDLTPYFMGFYGTRAEVKRHVRSAARPFFAAETFAVALGAADEDGRAAMAVSQPALERLTLADHHDFVTGTANDEVASTEQLPLLDAAELAGETAFGEVADALGRRIPLSAGAIGRVVAFNPSGIARTVVADPPSRKALGPLHAASGARGVPLEVLPASQGLRLAVEELPPFGWRAIDLFPGAEMPAPRVTLQLLDSAGQPSSGAQVMRVILQNEHVRAEWSRAGDFALTSLVVDGTEALSNRSFTVTDYTDQGGLWRLGNEMPGCALTAIAPSSSDAAGETVEVLDCSRLSARVAFVSATAVREARLDAGEAGLQLALTTSAQQMTTRTATFRFAAGASPPLRTSLAGGFAERPAERVYTPTFWPVVEWLSVGNWAVLVRQSTGARLSDSGEVELMAVRDARSEQCDIEGGTGTDTDTHRLEWYVTSAANPATAAAAAQGFNRAVVVRRIAGSASATADLAVEDSLLSVEGPGLVTAIKPAERGDGVIVRALLQPGPITLHLSPALAALKRPRPTRSSAI